MVYSKLLPAWHPPAAAPPNDTLTSLAGEPVPWYVNVDREIQTRKFARTLATNDAALEFQAAFSGQAIAQLSSLSAATLIRASQLTPLLIAHVASRLNLYEYCGSRKSQPLRVWRFIDLAVERFAVNSGLTLSSEELMTYAAMDKAPSVKTYLTTMNHGGPLWVNSAEKV